MTPPYNLQRFTDAQESKFIIALNEIKNGRKQGHWMWFIFPQICGLGFSETSKYYAIRDREEAEAYLKHPVLGKRLLTICRVLLELPDNHANRIFGSPDDLKLKSSITLFAYLNPTDLVFQSVLDKFFDGNRDIRTLEIIENPNREDA